MPVLYPEYNYTPGLSFNDLYNKVSQYQSTSPGPRKVVTNVDVSKYPHPYVIGSDNEELRAQTQSIWDQWGNAAARTGSQLFFGTLKGISDVPDVFRAIMGPDGLAALADEEFGNELSQGLASIMEGIKEKAPIYLERDERGFNPGKAAWWANNMDSIATGVSMLLPTIGAAKGVTLAAQILGKAAKGTKLAGLVAGKNGTAIMSSIAGALYGNAYESMQEMQQTLPQLREQMLSAGLDEKEVNKKLKEEAAKMYWHNLPNAALDMVGIYHLTKPMAGVDNIIETITKKRLGATALTEVAPEGVQELINYYNTQNAQASVDKEVGIRSSDYNLAEFINDPNSWTSGFFGALGGVAFAGGANAFNQMQENVKANKGTKATDTTPAVPRSAWHKGLFKGVGKAIGTGITTDTQKKIDEQSKILNTLAVRKQKLFELQKLSELGNNPELYKEVQESMEMLEAFKHMTNGTYGRFSKHVEDVYQALNQLETDEAADPKLKEEIKQQKEAINSLRVNMDKAVKHYNKGTTYYGFTGTKLFDYVDLSTALDIEKSKLNNFTLVKDKLFQEDEFGVLRQESSAKIKALQERIDLGAEDTNTLNDELDALTTSNPIDELDVNIAKQGLRVKELETAIKKLLKGEDDYKTKDPFSALLNEEYLKDLIYNAYNNSLRNKIPEATAEELMNTIFKDKKSLTPKAHAELKAKFEEAIEDLKGSEYAKVKDILRSQGIDPDSLSEDEYDEAEAKLISEARNLVEAAKNKLKSAIALASSLVNFNPKVRNASEIISEDILERVETISNVANEIINTEDNRDVTSLAKAMFELANIEGEVESTKYKLSSEVRPKIQEAKDLINKAKDAILAREEKNSKEQTEVFNNYIRSIAVQIRILNPTADTSTIKGIDTELSRLQKDKNNIKLVNEEIDRLAKEVKDLAEPFIKGRQEDAFTLNSFKTVPEAVIYSIILSGYYQSPISQRPFELSHDLNNIVLDEKNAGLVSKAKELITFVNLKRNLNNSKSFIEVFEAIKSVSEELNLFPFPNQLVSLIETVQWFSSSTDAAYLQGIAGSGKTNLVAKFIPKLLNKLYGLAIEEVHAMSNSEGTDRLIKSSVFGETTAEVINKDVNALRQKLADKKFVIVDEIGRFDGSEVSILKQIINEINATRTATNKIKILLTGDPNQYTADITAYAIDGYYGLSFTDMLRFITPLNHSLRAGNTEVKEFQNKFLRAGNNNAFAVNEFNESYDLDETAGVAITNTKTDFTASILNKVRTGEDFAIIVQTEEQKAAYKKLVNPTNDKAMPNRVFTFQEAQGLEWDSVFIDIPTYTTYYDLKYRKANSMMYTATSRARNFINILTKSIPSNKAVNDVSSPLVLGNIEQTISTNMGNMLDLFNEVLGIETKAEVTEQEAPEDPVIDPNELEFIEEFPQEVLLENGIVRVQTGTNTFEWILNNTKAPVSSDGGKKADIERGRQEELNNVGIKQKQSAFTKLRDEKDEDGKVTRVRTPEEKLNAINLIDRNVEEGAILTKEELREVQKVKDELSSQGYEVPKLLGQRFHQGMKVIVASSIPDETLAEGEEVITKIMTPQINKDDKMVQTAQIEVTVGTKKGGLTREQWLEEQNKEEKRTDKINAKYDAELAAIPTSGLFPNYDGLIALQRNEQGEITNPQVSIVYRNANPNDPNKADVQQKVYLIRNSVGSFVEVAVVNEPKTTTIKLPFKRTYTEQELETYVTSGGIAQEGIVTSFSKRVFEYDYNNLNTLETLQKLAEESFKLSEGVVNRRLTSVELAHYFVGTDANIGMINNTFLKDDVLKLSKSIEESKKNRRGGGHDYVITPGQPYVLVRTTHTNIAGQDEKVKYQVIQLEGAKLNQETSKVVKTLKSVLAGVSEVEALFKKDFNYDYKFGSSVETTITRADNANENYTEAALFLNSLMFNIQDDKLISESKLPVTQRLHEEINKHANAKDIINKLLKVKNLLRKSDAGPGMVKAGSLDFDSYSKFNNAFTALSTTRVKKLPKMEALSLLKDPTMYEYFTNQGFDFVRASNLFSSVEARKTLEVSGKDSNGNIKLYHVLISVEFNRLIEAEGRRYVLRPNASPQIEIFELDPSKYEKFALNPKDKELKAEALIRNRVGYAKNNTEVNKVFDSENSFISLPTGLASLANLKETIESILITGKDKLGISEGQEAINEIAKANKKIFIPTPPGEDLAYVIIRREKLRPYEEGNKTVRRVYGPSFISSDPEKITFNIIRVKPDGTEYVKKGETIVVDNEEIDSVEAINLRELLEQVILNPSLYDANGDSMHNKIGLREAIQDRPMKLINETILKHGPDGSDNYDIAANEYSKLRSAFVRTIDSYVNIEEKGAPAAPAPTPITPTTPSEESTNFFDDILDPNALREDIEDDDNDAPPFFNNKVVGVSQTSVLNKPEVISYIKKYIPNITEEEVSMQLNALLIANKAYGPEILGAFKEGIIYLLAGTNNTFEKEVVRHEVFHKIFAQFLPTDVRTKLLKHARKLQGNLSDLLLEEFLAERFQKYNVGEEETDSILKSFFNWFRDLILNLFGFISKNEVAIDRIFDKIESGFYSTELVNKTQLGSDIKFLKDTTKLFPAATQAESYAEAAKAIDYVKKRMTHFHLKEQLFFEEAVAKVYSEMQVKLEKAFSKHGITKEVVRQLFNPKNSIIKQNPEMSREEYEFLLASQILNNVNTIKSYNDQELTTLFYIISKNEIVYKKILEEIFPSQDLTELLKAVGSAGRLLSEDLDEDEYDSKDPKAKEADIVDAIDNIHTDQETRISRELKILLSFIENKNSYIPSRYAYAKAVEIFMYSSTVEQMRNQLLAIIQTEGNEGNLGRLASELYNVITQATMEAFPFNGEDVELSGYPQLTYYDNKFQVYGVNIPTPSTNITKEYHDKVIEELGIDPLLGEALLKAVKRRDFNKDLLAKIHYELASQAETNPIVDQYADVSEGENELDFENKYRFTTFDISASGVKENIRGSILGSLQELVASNSLAELKDLKNAASRVDLGIILNKLGVANFVFKEFTVREINSIRAYYSKTLDTLIAKYPELSRSPKELSTEIDKAGLVEFSETFLKNSDFVTTLNYKDSKGNSRYIYVMGAWIYDVLGSLKDGKNIPYQKKTGYIAQNNAFVQGVNKVHSIINFDYLRQRNSDFDPTGYKNLNPGQFLLHRFVASFIGSITRGLDDTATPKYNQYVYIQSNRNADSGAEINVLNNKKLEEAFNMAKAMEQSRPEALKGIANVKEGKNQFFTKYNNFSEFKTAMNEQAFEAFKVLVEEFELIPRMSLTSGNSFNIDGKDKVITRLTHMGLLNEAMVDADMLRIEKAIPDITTNGAKLYPIFKQFYIQNYLNGFHLSAAVFGDTVFTKDMDDLIKRMQGVGSPGKKQLTGTIGNKETSNVAVAEDIEMVINAINDPMKIFSKIYGGSINSTDAYTLGTPTTLKGIHRGTGDYNLKDIIKIVSFYVDPETNITHYIKTALFIINDSLARMFPALKETRRKMETYGMDTKTKNRYNYLYEKLLSRTISPKEFSEYESLVQNSVEYLTVKSAYKVGRPADKNLLKAGEEIKENNVVKIRNQYVRIQSNPYHHEGDVSDPSQFNYFINVNGKNEAEAFKVYSLAAEIMKTKWEAFVLTSGIFSKNADGKLVANSKALANHLINELKNMPTSDEKMYELLKAGVDINYPSMMGRALISLFNSIARNSVEIRHSGNKLVAQSAAGVRLYNADGKVKTYDKLTGADKIKANNFQALPEDVKNALTGIQDILNKETVVDTDGTKISAVDYVKKHLKEIKESYNLVNEEAFKEAYNNENVLVPRRLQMRDKDGFTEVVAPRWWLSKRGYKEGDTIYSPLYGDLLSSGMAVRIPTTGIHSAVALRIVADSSEGFNRVIAPEELVALHGSDFDIDALFSLRRETFDKSLLSAKALERMASKFPEFHTNYMKSPLGSLKATDLVGYNYKGEWDTIFENALEELIKTAPSRAIKADLLNIKVKVLLNKKLDTEIAIITAEKNASDMNTPISFEAIKFDLFAGLKFNGKSIDIDKAQSNESKIFFDSINETLSVVLDMKEFNKGRIIINDKKVESTIINHPDVGFVTKLKIVTESQDLKEFRDPNNIISMMKYHKDNFEGAAGTGIQANMSKADSYLKYGSSLAVNGQVVSYKDIKTIEDNKVVLKDGTVIEGKIDRFKVSIKTPITIAYPEGTITYDSLEMETKRHKKKVYEISDTVLNGYIDNVKEQITWIINATPVTIETISYMMAIGIDLDTIGFFMNQPIMKYLAKSRVGIDRRITVALGKMEKALNMLGNNIKNLNKLDLTISQEDMIESIKFFSKSPFSVNKVLSGEATISDKLAPILEKIIRTQAVVLLNFNNLKQGGTQLGKFSRSLSLLRNFPVSPEAVFSKNVEVESLVTVPDYFGAPQALEIPHISTAMEMFKMAHTAMGETFDLLNPYMIIKLKNLADSLGLRSTSNTYRAASKNFSFMRSEVESIIVSRVLSRLIADMKSKGLFTVPEVRTINSSTGNFITNLVKLDEKTSKPKYLDETSAFLQNFLLNLRTRKNNKEFEKNAFLGALNIKLSDKGILFIDFHRGTGNDSAYDALLVTHFLQLPEDVRAGLMVYDLSINKAKFGFKGFANFMGTATTANLSKVYMQELNTVIKNWEQITDYMRYLILKNPNNHEYLDVVMSDYSFSSVSNDIKTSVLNQLEIPEESHGSYKVTKSKNLIKSAYPFIGITNKFNGVDIYMLYPSKGDLLVYKKIDSSAYTGTYRYDFELADDFFNKALNKMDYKVISNEDFDVLMENKSLKRESPSYSSYYMKKTTEVGEDNQPQTVDVKTDKKLPIPINDFPLLLTTSTGRSVEVLYTRNTKVNETEETYSISEIFKLKENNTKALEQRTSKEQRVSEEVLKGILDKLSKRFGISYTTINDASQPWTGKFSRGKVTINLANAKLDTPFHEFAHPFISVIKKTNPELYFNLVKEIGDTNILEGVRTRYPDLSSAAQIEEAIVEAIGLYASKTFDPETNTTLWSLIEELLNFITELLRQLLRSPYISPSALNVNLTLKELGAIVGNLDTDNKIDLTSELEKTEILDMLQEQGLIKFTCRL